MLVAAKVLAQEGKLEAAIGCTREIRNLAARRSALPSGSSGVASAVSHEAFMIEASIVCIVGWASWRYLP